MVVPAVPHETQNASAFSRDDVLVEVMRVGIAEAELVAARLRAAGVPATVFAVGTAGELASIQYSEGSRVMVRRGDAADARRVVIDLFEEPDTRGQISDEELARLAEVACDDRGDPGSGAVV